MSDPHWIFPFIVGALLGGAVGVGAMCIWSMVKDERSEERRTDQYCRKVLEENDQLRVALFQAQQMVATAAVTALVGEATYGEEFECH